MHSRRCFYSRHRGRPTGVRQSGFIALWFAASITFLAMTILVSTPAQAQALEGSDTLPGVACDREGAVRMTANAAGPGAYVLTCDGTEWVATINAELPTANEQVANKEYVDSAVAAGGIGACVDDDATLCALETSRSSNDPEFTASNIANGVNILGVTGTLSGAAPDCTNDSSVTCTLDATRDNDDPDFTAANIADGVNILGVTGTLSAGGGLSGPVDCPDIGDECTAQGNIIFAGWHPITHEHLFIPPYDESGTPAYRASGSGSDGAASIDDGLANTNAVPNSTAYPAFKACKDLGFGSHNDWYLPSQVELYYLWAVHETIETGGNITNFQNAYYWSSTEVSTTNAWVQFFPYGGQGTTNKANGYRVRCVRR